MLKRMTYSAAALATGLLLIAAPVRAQGRPLVAPLAGGVDPDQGDVDGSGAAWIDLNQGQKRICLSVEVQGIAPVGEVRLVDLGTQETVLVLQSGLAEESNCITAEQELIKDIRQNFSNYAVSVDSSQYPEGAIEGALQLPSAAANDDVLKVMRPNSGVNIVAESPGLNKVGESPEDHDQGFGNDDSADHDEDVDDQEQEQEQEQEHEDEQEQEHEDKQEQEHEDEQEQEHEDKQEQEHEDKNEQKGNHEDRGDNRAQEGSGNRGHRGDK